MSQPLPYMSHDGCCLFLYFFKCDSFICYACMHVETLKFYSWVHVNHLIANQYNHAQVCYSNNNSINHSCKFNKQNTYPCLLSNPPR